MESIPAPAARCRRRLLLADGVSVAAAPLAGACSPRRGHGYPQARGKTKGRARPAEGQRPSEFLRCPSGKSKPQTQDLLHACFNLAQDLNQVRIVPGQSSECSELRTCIEKAPTQASKLVSQNTQVPKQAWLSTPVTSRLGMLVPHPPSVPFSDLEVSIYRSPSVGTRIQELLVSRNPVSSLTSACS